MAAIQRPPQPAAHLGLAIYDQQRSGDFQTVSSQFRPQEPVIDRRGQDLTNANRSRWSAETKSTVLSARSEGTARGAQASPRSSGSAHSRAASSRPPTLSPASGLMATPKSIQTERSASPAHELDSRKAQNANPAQVTRRPSLTQNLMRTFSSGGRKHQPEKSSVQPPLPANAKEIVSMNNSSKKPPTVQFSPVPNGHQPNVLRKASDAGSRRSSGATIGGGQRRTSLFQSLRKSFSRASGDSAVASPKRKSSVETVRKMSRSSAGTATPDVSARDLAHSVVASARDNSPALNRRFAPSPRPAENIARQQGNTPFKPSPLMGQTTTPLHLSAASSSAARYAAAINDAPKLNHLRGKGPAARSMPSLQLTQAESPLMQLSLSQQSSESCSTESMLDLYQHDEDEAPTPAIDSDAPPSANPSFVSSVSTPPADEQEAPLEKPVWENANLFGGSFINPWSSKLQSRKTSTIDTDASPGGRRSSIASSKHSAGRPHSRESHSRSTSTAASRRASLAQNVRDQNYTYNQFGSGISPTFPGVADGFQNLAAHQVSDSPASFASTISIERPARRERKKPRPLGIIHGNFSTSALPDPSKVNTVRKSSLVHPGDGHNRRRKSSLSVTFLPVDSEQQPLQPLPAVPSSPVVQFRPTYFDRPPSSSDDSSSVASSSFESDLESSPEPNFGNTKDFGGNSLFFQLRNPWTGNTVHQPQSNAFASQTYLTPLADSSRRPTILPATPKSAKSLSISSLQAITGQDKASRGNVRLQPGQSAKGFRVSIDTNAFDTYSEY